MTAPLSMTPDDPPLPPSPRPGDGGQGSRPAEPGENAQATGAEHGRAAAAEGAAGVEADAMRRAVALSTAGRSAVRPAPPVGCVVLDAGGRVVGEGATQPGDTSHAEARALAAAGERAAGGTVVVTFEPCGRDGPRPSCAEALVDAGVRRVVIAVADPSADPSDGDGHPGGGADRLRAAGIAVEVGTASDDALAVLGPWLAARHGGRPQVTWAYHLGPDGPAPVPRDRAAELAPRREFDAVLRDDGLPGTGTRIVHGQGAFPPEPVDLDGGAAAALASLHAAGTRALLLDGGQPLAQPFLDAGLVDEVRVHVPTAPADDGTRPTAGPLVPPQFQPLRLRTLEGLVVVEATRRPEIELGGGGETDRAGGEPGPAPIVEVVVPVHNEEAGLEASVRRLHGYLAERFPLAWVVTVADNASTDATWDIACRLSDELDGVRAVHLDRKGRGLALRTTWSASDAQVVAYMDADLSTDLDALLPLVAPLVSGHSDIAIGTRLAAAAQVVRGPRREVISRCYNILLRGVLRVGFSDAQCGFKAMRTDTARALLPLVEDDTWFFDTELLVLGEHNGLRIHEVPVDWVDDPDSRVDVVRTATDDLRGVLRVLGRFWRGEAFMPQPGAPPEQARDRLSSQLVRFASIGLVSTAVFGLLFALLRGPLGAPGAVVVAMVACTAANTTANRRLTFALRGRAGAYRHLLVGAALSLVPLVLALAALGVLSLAGIDSLGPQLLAVTLASGTGALLRFVALRSWVFDYQSSRPSSSPAPP
ncbi:MAG TPA: glycosyltransferase [Acidimicrobiales bacterium]|nr:glycosyltransferase [Acidimicrobiales bacterium]